MPASTEHRRRLALVAPSRQARKTAKTKIASAAAGGKPVEFATVALKNSADGKILRTAATDAKGEFEFEGLPAGEYRVVFALVGGAREGSAAFALDAAHRSVALGKLALAAPEAPVKLEAVEVSTLDREPDERRYQLLLGALRAMESRDRPLLVSGMLLKLLLLEYFCLLLLLLL